MQSFLPHPGKGCGTSRHFRLYPKRRHAQRHPHQAKLLGFEAVASDDHVELLQQRAALELGSNVPGKHLALAAGDFDGDHKDELVCVYNDAGSLMLVAVRYHEAQATSPAGFASAMPAAALGKVGTGKVRTTVGTFGVPSTLQCAISWTDPTGQLHIEIWGVTGSPDGPLQARRHAVWDGVSLLPGTPPHPPTLGANTRLVQ